MAPPRSAITLRSACEPVSTAMLRMGAAPGAFRLALIVPPAMVTPATSAFGPLMTAISSSASIGRIEASRSGRPSTEMVSVMKPRMAYCGGAAWSTRTGTTPAWLTASDRVGDCRLASRPPDSMLTACGTFDTAISTREMAPVENTAKPSPASPCTSVAASVPTLGGASA